MFVSPMSAEVGWQLRKRPGAKGNDLDCLGLLLQLLLALTDELESKIYAFGARNDENIRDILAKVKSLGASEKRR
jgi:hypothetical protein